jgi:PST family polysaccharide transporter
LTTKERIPDKMKHSLNSEPADGDQTQNWTPPSSLAELACGIDPIAFHDAGLLAEEIDSTSPHLPKSSLRENIAWLSALQIVNYLLPLVTIPFLIRVLGVGKYGILSFCITVAQYMVVFTDYGFNLSATRQVAFLRDSRLELERAASAVFAFKFALLLTCGLALVAFLYFMPKYQPWAGVMAAAFLIVVGSAAFPTWLFQGLQDMRIITVITVIGRIICTSAIFLTVHSSRDLLNAVLWSSASFPISAVLSWFVIYKRYRLRLHLPSLRSLSDACKSGFHTFVSSMMSNGLANGAVLVLGFLAPPEIVGTYAGLEKIAKAGSMALAPITQSLYPRSAEQFAISHAAGCAFVLRSGKRLLLLTGVICGGLILFAKFSILLIFGASFVHFYPVVWILALWLFLGVLNNILGIQYLLGSGRASSYSGAFTCATIATFLLLFLLIPRNQCMGAAVAITLGEALLTLMMACSIRRSWNKNRPQGPISDSNANKFASYDEHAA